MYPHPWSRRACVIIGSLLLGPLAVTPAMAQQPPPRARGCDELFQAPGVAWRGTNGTMTLEQLASYVAPVLWFSPDEPTLQRRSGQDIRIPTTMPFEPTANAPVMYYQVTTIDGLPGEKADTLQPDRSNKGQTIVDFDTVTALRIKYIAYFPEESGVGQHLHDIEPTEVRVVVGRANGALARNQGYVCDSPDYLIVVIRVTGEAHGNPWYYNVLMVDTDTRLPIHVLVEEGKHGMATDKNADGYYTPGYDVSVRTNDAWGVRDTIRGGSLLSGKFEGWMAKVRRPEHRVLPPLPPDSPLRERLLNRSGEAPDNAVYELRPYPSSSLATDRLLRQKIAEKETPNWPVVQPPRVRRADRRGDQRGARAQAVLSGLPLRRDGRLRRGRSRCSSSRTCRSRCRVDTSSIACTPATRTFATGAGWSCTRPPDRVGSTSTWPEAWTRTASRTKTAPPGRPERSWPKPASSSASGRRTGSSVRSRTSGASAPA